MLVKNDWGGQMELQGVLLEENFALHGREPIHRIMGVTQENSQFVICWNYDIEEIKKRFEEIKKNWR